MKFDAKKDIFRLAVLVGAAFLMALNIKTFVRAGGLYPGGVTGLTVLIQRAAEQYLHIEIPYTPVNLALNAVPIYIGFRYVGKKFTLFSLFMIVMTSVATKKITASQSVHLLRIASLVLPSFLLYAESYVPPVMAEVMF